VHPDQDHEHRDQRQGHSDEHRADRVQEAELDDDGHRHGRGEDELGEELGYVRVEALEPAGEQGRGRAGAAPRTGIGPRRPDGPVRRRRPAQDRRAQVCGDPGGAAVGGLVLHPREQRPRDDDAEQAHQTAADRGQRAVVDGARDQRADQPGLREHQAGHGDTDGGGDRQVAPGRRGRPQQPRVDRAHRLRPA
jgi:hypothetical protein